MDSCLARSINAHVFTTSTSACDASAVISCPSFSAMPSITSESTRFLGHPKETNPIFIGTYQCSISSAIEKLADRVGEGGRAERFLQEIQLGVVDAVLQHRVVGVARQEQDLHV